MLLWQKQSRQVALRVAVAGDFLPSRDLTLPPQRDWQDMASLLAPHFADVDIAIANLECPLGIGGLRPKTKLGLGAHFAGPIASLEYLSSLGVEIVGLANNHIYDFGEAGAVRTSRALLRRNMFAIGIGKSLSDHPDIGLWRGWKDIRVGFWAAAQGLNELASRKSGIEPATRKRGAAAVEELDRQGARLKIALLHLGLERTNLPDPEDVSLMRSLCQSGFDVVAAAHSHRISGWDVVARPGRSDSFCFYGLGSLASNIIYSPLEREGLVVVLGVDSKGEIVRLEVRPVHLQDVGWGTVPDPSVAHKIEQRFTKLSQEIASGEFASRFYSEVSRGFFHRHLRDFRTAIRNGGLRGAVLKMGRLRKRHLKRMIQAALNGASS
ncbi:MAG TPA: CapA family protein [Candidatus Acidoferrum sp.]|nr:CapA family protein [Candidatus Acidoferrum sp.]